MNHNPTKKGTTKNIAHLMHRLENAVSPFHVVQQCQEELHKAGFTSLSMSEPWELAEHGKYFVNHHGSTLIAFQIPTKEKLKGKINPHLRIAAAHTDYPCLRIKSNPDMHTEGYGKLNTEVYGGAILNTWLDRPLGVAGKVALHSQQVFSPCIRYFHEKQPLLTIPNLAVHMNREVNKGVELNKQTDMIPLISATEKEMNFLDYLAEQLQVKQADILDYELTVYVHETPQLLGLSREMLSSPRIDNVSSVEAIMSGLCEKNQEKEADALLIGALFDHEEIGSRTKQGAQSAILTDVIEKIYESLGYSKRDAKDAIYQGMMLSVDVAHALHPNHPQKEDVTNKPVMNQGFCIKEASTQSYATDCEAIAIVEQLAAKYHIPYQKFVNRSDMPGGGTLGALSSALLPMKTVDLGIPVLAMHSAREVMGVEDMKHLTDIVTSFYWEP